MKKTITALSLSLLMAMPVCAATKQEKAEELLKMMNTQSIFDTVYTQAIIPLSCEIIMSPEEEIKLKDDFMKIADMDALMKTLSKFWVDNYTDQELDELLAFYKTDLGKKAIQLTPQYTQYSMTELQKWGEEKGAAFEKLGEDLARKYSRRSGLEVEACIKSKMGM
ncbi:MAG: DUF2059 domain-containing protein [Pseudomonadota bacterium]|nr:DUF2059 domain-containing protein [Pseudomonadota bacterium]